MVLTQELGEQDLANIPKEPNENIKIFIKEHYVYDNGTIKSWRNEDIGYLRKSKFNSKPYRMISFHDGNKTRNIKRSHIVWFLVKGKWPTSEIDHINTNTLDDRIENLRLSSHTEQQRNKSNNTQYKGFSIHYSCDKPRDRPYRVRNQKLGINLGYFFSIEECKDAIDKWLVNRGLEGV